MAHSIIVENLSKQYRIGELHRETTLSETLIHTLTQLFKRKRKETIWALKDVSFKINAGEVLGIIGRNGSGKSTVLKVLAKITYPTSGTTKVLGRVASLLEVGTGFHEELTGRENIYLNGSILGMTKRETDAKLDEIIDFSGVEKFVDTPIKRYSSGMRLRLGFAVAAHLETEVLLVDEILAVGDAEFQKKCLKTMGNLSGTGRTVLFVSHNMEAIKNLCQRVIWIDNGKVRQDGEPREVIKDYMSSFIGMHQPAHGFAHITNRGGNGDIRYNRIEFLSSDKQPLKAAYSGNSFVARLYYYAEKQIPSPHFGLELFTELGTKITSFNTWTSGFEVPFLPPGNGYIDLEVESLNISAGRYYISLWIASSGNLWYDRLEQCAVLDVEPSDFYKSGREIKRQHTHLFGIVLFPCKWNLKGESPK